MTDYGTAYVSVLYDDSYATPIPLIVGEYSVEQWPSIEYYGFTSLVEDGSVTEGDVEEATRVYPRVPRERNTP
jgi:hypothetical protein